MKKILVILCLFAFALPSFSADGYNKDFKFKVYDDNGTQAYAQKLDKEYHAKVEKGECERSDATYSEYVAYPLYEYIKAHPIDYGDKPDKHAESHPVLDKRQSHELYKLLVFLLGTFVMCF